MTRTRMVQFRRGWMKGFAASCLHKPEPLGIYSEWLALAPIIEARGFARGYRYGLRKYPLTREQVYLLRTKAPPNLRLFVF